MAETVGSIIDKINVIELKLYHTSELMSMPGCDADKKQVLENKISVLNELKGDLSAELDQLLKDITSGKKKLKVYRQFKMYGQKKP